MAKDTLRNTSDATAGGLDKMKDSGGGTSAKGYAEHEVDGSEYNRFGNRIDYNKLSAHTFK